MSWHYLQGQEAVSSEGICWDGKQFAPSKLKTTLGGYCSKDNETESFHGFRYGTTLQRLTEDHGKGELMSFPGGSLVKTFQQQEKELASRANGRDSGAKWPGWLAKYDPDSCSWKTPQCSLLGDLEEYSETWPQWGTMQDGACWELMTPEHHIEEKESGYWPTASARDWKDSPGMSQTGINPDGTIRKRTDQLARAVYATPQSRDFRTGEGHRWKDPNRSQNLNDQIAYIGGTQTRQTFPTPKTNGFCSGSGAAQMVNDLAESGKIDEQTRKSMRAGNGGQLNPDWVELLMGWPKSWTSLNPISVIEYKKWLMGFKYEKESGKENLLSELREVNREKKVQQWKAGRYDGFQEEEILQSKLCKYSERYNEIGLALAGKEISEESLRMLWDITKASSSSCGWELQEPKSRELTDIMYSLSSLYPSYGAEAWKRGTWEAAVPRVGSGIKNRVDRLKAIGNGQVPAVAALAFTILSKGLI